MMSMGIGKKEELPSNFVGMDMNASFYRDLDLQQAAEEQIKKARRKWPI